MKASLKRRDYREYTWSGSEVLLTGLQVVGVVVALSWFFYRSLWAVIPLSVLGVLYYRVLREEKIEKCRQQLLYEFKECVLSVATALRAGYAVENAFLESCNDMRMLFGEQSLIFRELEVIRRGLVINITLEELLKDLGDRSACPEMQQFAEVFAIAKRSGGNLTEIIRDSAEIIRQRIDTALEIRTLLSGRALEQKVMKLMPFGILLYIGVTNPGYFDSLYHNWQGILIMTACLGVYLLAYVLSNRILGRVAAELTV